MKFINLVAFAVLIFVFAATITFAASSTARVACASGRHEDKLRKLCSQVSGTFKTNTTSSTKPKDQTHCCSFTQQSGTSLFFTFPSRKPCFNNARSEIVEFCTSAFGHYALTCAKNASLTRRPYVYTCDGKNSASSVAVSPSGVAASQSGAAASISGAAASQSGVAPSISVSTSTAATRKLFFGATVGNESYSQFETNAGRNTSIYQTYLDFSTSLNVSELQYYQSIGKIFLATIQPSLGFKTLTQIINGSQDAFITEQANLAKSFGDPFFYRIFPEMNTGDNDWSEDVNGNTPGQNVQAWIHVYNIFQNVGATNANFMWCPNVNFDGSSNVTALYPGDAYVDWVCLDGYNFGVSTEQATFENFTQVFKPTYDEITSFTSKPFIIAETGTSAVGGNKTNWITDALNVELPYNFPKFNGIVWFDLDKEEDWRIEETPEDQLAFKRGINNGFYTTNTYGKGAFTGPKIPAP